MYVLVFISSLRIDFQFLSLGQSDHYHRSLKWTSLESLLLRRAVGSEWPDSGLRESGQNANFTCTHMVRIPLSV